MTVHDTDCTCDECVSAAMHKIAIDEAARVTQHLERVAALVNRFLMWPLPQTVCSDTCVTDSKYRFPRSGTNLLSADEARQMIEHLLADEAGNAAR